MRSRRAIRPTPRILMWAAVDIVGVLLLALGAAYLVRGPGFFFAQVPDSTFGAVVCVVLGLGTICVAAVRMLTEVFKQMPDAGGPR